MFNILSLGWMKNTFFLILWTVIYDSKLELMY